MTSRRPSTESSARRLPISPRYSRKLASDGAPDMRAMADVSAGHLLQGCVIAAKGTTTMRLRTLWLAVVALCAASSAPLAQEQYPNQRVTIVVPFGAGSN